ncbi:unnamed protein product, partial [Rotaria magnacalcarata]
YCGDNRPYIYPHQLDVLHQNARQEAIEKFLHVTKMDKLYTNYKKYNDSKNVFAFSRTRITLISSMVLCYLISGIFKILGLG